MLLAYHFIQEFNREWGKNVQGLDSEAERLLRRYPWPGNVRELRNVIERAMLLTQGTVLTSRDLVGLPTKEAPEGEDIVPLEEMERRYILRVLEHTGGNQRQAARLLGISRETLRSKLKKWGIL
jgi:two-component system response regulator HydG